MSVNQIAPQTPNLLTGSLQITSDDQGPTLHGKAVPLRVPLPPIRLQLDVGASRWKTEAGLKALLPPDGDELTTDFICQERIHVFLHLVGFGFKSVALIAESGLCSLRFSFFN